MASLVTEGKQLRVKIKGGPGFNNLKIYDAETGKQITNIASFELSAQNQETVVKIGLYPTDETMDLDMIATITKMEPKTILGLVKPMMALAFLAGEKGGKGQGTSDFTDWFETSFMYAMQKAQQENDNNGR